MPVKFSPRRAFAAVLLLCLITMIGCSVAQKAAANKALTGTTQPTADTQPTGESIEGMTQSAATVFAGTPIGEWILALLGLEKLAVYVVKLLPNGRSSPSPSASTLASGNPSSTTTTGPTPGSKDAPIAVTAKAA